MVNETFCSNFSLFCWVRKWRLFQLVHSTEIRLSCALIQDWSSYSTNATIIQLESHRKKGKDGRQNALSGNIAWLKEEEGGRRRHVYYRHKYYCLSKIPKGKLSTLHAEAFELCSNVPWVNLYAECLKIGQYYKIVVFGAVNETYLAIFKHALCVCSSQEQL